MIARRFVSGCLVVASHNEGKVREFKALLEPYSAEVVSAGELNLSEPEETGTSFVANAELKALASAKASGRVSLADDSGLAVSALGGAPGIYSARWAGQDKDFTVAMNKVETELGNAPDRSARFVCALALAWPDGHRQTFEGSILGALSFPPRGDKGFGYDPIFVPSGFDITFGEMEPDKKHNMSHRAEAFKKLVAACFA